MFIRLFSSLLEATSFLEVLRASAFPLLPGKRNSPAEEQVKPGPTTRTLFAGMRKPRGPSATTTDAHLILFPLLRILLQPRKTLLGMKRFQTQGLSCSTFSMRLPQPFPSTFCFHALSTCRLQGRSCSYLLDTAKIPWQGSSGCQKHSAVTCQIHPHRRQLHPPTSPAVKAIVSTLKKA